MKDVRIGLDLPSGSDGKGGSGGRGVGPREFRARFSEREFWVVILNPGDNTFDLRGLGGAVLSKVKGIKPGLWRTIKVGSTVTLCWTEGGVDGVKIPYVRGIAGVRTSTGCDIEPLHPHGGTDPERTGNEIEAGRAPSGIRMDPNWKTELVGNAWLEWPNCLLTGKINGRPVGWTEAAGSAATSAQSNNQTKRITCFDLLTGQTLWQVDKFAPTALGQNIAQMILEPTAGELLLVSQFQTGVGTFTLQRISACTGETLAKTDNLQDEMDFAPLLVANGEILLPSRVYTPSGFTGDKAKRVQAWRRAPLIKDGAGEAYQRAYQVRIPEGGELVGVGASGGAVVGGYWAAGEQAILLPYELQSGSNEVIRARVIAFDVRTGRVQWTWQPHEQLGLEFVGRYLFDQQVQRDPDGSLYYTARLDAPLADKSYCVKISSNGETLWKQEVSAQGIPGKFFNGFQLGGVLGPSFLCTFNYNDVSIGQRPILINRASGTITEGVQGWRQIGQAFGTDWIYCFVKQLSSPTRFRYYITNRGLQPLVEWQQTGVISRHERTTPDAGPVTLYDGWIYGINWDASAGGWRIRRWQ